MTRTAHFGRKGPKADIRLDLFAAQKSPGRYRGFKFGGRESRISILPLQGCPS